MLKCRSKHETMPALPKKIQFISSRKAYTNLPEHSKQAKAPTIIEASRRRKITEKKCLWRFSFKEV
jgi:hypothetical protein